MVCLGKTDDASLTDPNRVRTKECKGDDDPHKCSTSMVHILFLKTVVQYCDFMSCVFFDCNLWILCYFCEEGSGFWVLLGFLNSLSMLKLSFFRVQCLGMGCPQVRPPDGAAEGRDPHQECPPCPSDVVIPHNNLSEFFSDPPVIPAGYHRTEVVCLKSKTPGGGDFSRAVKYRNWKVERTKKQSVLHTMALPFI